MGSLLLLGGYYWSWTSNDLPKQVGELCECIRFDDENLLGTKYFRLNKILLSTYKLKKSLLSLLYVLFDEYRSVNKICFLFLEEFLVEQLILLFIVWVYKTLNDGLVDLFYPFLICILNSADRRVDCRRGAFQCQSFYTQHRLSQGWTHWHCGCHNHYHGRRKMEKWTLIPEIMRWFWHWASWNLWGHRKGFKCFICTTLQLNLLRVWIHDFYFGHHLRIL